MQRAAFDREFARLVTESERTRDNIACYESDSSHACRESTFCVNSAKLIQCHYCEACAECVNCSRCTECASCTSCTQCVRCEGCHQSAYLVQCHNCVGCTYCYGCVGLFGKDFHILNVPYDRDTYFRTIAELEGRR